METLAASVTRFFLQKHYIESEQAEWFQYGLTRRMIGGFTFLLLLPVGAILAGWIGSFLYLYTFHFLRTRTGGYHAKTPHGCLLVSLCTMLVALILAKFLTNAFFGVIVLFGSAVCIFVLAPANSAAIHLTTSEIVAIRPRIWIRPCQCRLGRLHIAIYLYTSGKLHGCCCVSGCNNVSLCKFRVWSAVTRLNVDIQYLGREEYHEKEDDFGAKLVA